MSPNNVPHHHGMHTICWKLHHKVYDPSGVGASQLRYCCKSRVEELDLALVSSFPLIFLPIYPVRSMVTLALSLRHKHFALAAAFPLSLTSTFIFAKPS